MQDDTPKDARLDDIETRWSLLRIAHQAPVSQAGRAREALVLRYSQAIRGYVGALLRDEHEADELSQEVVVRLLKGDFRRATPEKGRFRHLLKVAVKNMVRTHLTRASRRKKRDFDVADVASRPDESADELDTAWVESWRGSVLANTWRALESWQRSTPGNVSYALLRLRSDHPDDSIAELAARLSEATKRQYRADAVRQQLRRARLRFAQLLAEEVAGSLDDPTPERVEEELIELGLHKYVADFLQADWRTSGVLRQET